MAVNVQYQYRGIQPYEGDGFFTAYMSAWMRARVPLVQARLKAQTDNSDMVALMKMRTDLMQEKSDVAQSNQNVITTAMQANTAQNRGAVDVQVANTRASAQIGVASINRERVLRNTREMGKIRWGESNSLADTEKQNLNARLAGIQSVTTTAMNSARTSEERDIAYRAGLAQAASTIASMLPDNDPVHAQRIKNEAADMMRQGTPAATSSGEEAATMRRAEQAAYWSAETIRSAPSNELYGAEGIDYEQMMGLSPLPGGGGYRAAPVPTLQGQAPGAPAAPAPAVAAPAPPQAVTSVPVVAPAPAAAPVVAPVVAAPPAAPVAAVPAPVAPAPAAVAPQAPAVAEDWPPKLKVGIGAGGGSVADVADLAQRGTGVSQTATAALDTGIADLDKRIADLLSEKARTGSRSTIDLREPMERPLDGGMSKERLAGLSDQEAQDLDIRLQSLPDIGDRTRAETLRRGAAVVMAKDPEKGRRMLVKAEAREKSTKQFDRMSAGPRREEEKAFAVRSANSPTDIEPGSNEGDVLSQVGGGREPMPTSTEPDWVDKGKKENEIQKVAADEAAGVITKDEAAARVKTIQERAPEAAPFDMDRAAKTKLELAGSVDDVIADQVSAIVGATGGDPAKVRSLREKAPTKTPEEQQLVKALAEWEAAHAADEATAKREAEQDTERAAARTATVAQDTADREAKDKAASEVAPVKPVFEISSDEDFKDFYNSTDPYAIAKAEEEKAKSAPKEEPTGEPSAAPDVPAPPAGESIRPPVRTAAAPPQDPDTAAVEEAARKKGWPEEKVKKAVEAYRKKKTNEAGLSLTGAV